LLRSDLVAFPTLSERTKLSLPEAVERQMAEVVGRGITGMR
jgi:hypothetical protein